MYLSLLINKILKTETETQLRGFDNIEGDDINRFSLFIFNTMNTIKTFSFVLNIIRDFVICMEFQKSIPMKWGNLPI